MKKNHPSDRYLCTRSHCPGVAELYLGDTWTDKKLGGPFHAGFVVSTYGGFAPDPWGSLANGFISKKCLARFCQDNGFAIYWRQ